MPEDRERLNENEEDIVGRAEDDDDAEDFEDIEDAEEDEEDLE